LNGNATQPSHPDHDSAAASQLRLAGALTRAGYAIAWEQAWPHLARFLTVIGLFLALSWLGLWLVLPFVGRVIGVCVIIALAVASLVPLRHFRWPARRQTLSRLDRESGIRHRPATTLTDTLSTADPFARALWQAERQRMREAFQQIRAGLPRPRRLLQDPWALSALVILVGIASFVAAGGERMMRIQAAFDWHGVFVPGNVRVDAWVTPPLYTARPPLILSNAGTPTGAVAGLAIPVPVGSTLITRSSAGGLDVVTSGGVIAVASNIPGADERHFTISGDGSAEIRSPSAQPRWSFTALPDRPPTIALARDPEYPGRGQLRLLYRVEDDYGVSSAEARFAALATQSAPTHPLFPPPQFALQLPSAHTRSGVGQTVRDLSEDPYAGTELVLTLVARDEAGNEAKSTPFTTFVPERLFVMPLARALIEQRRILALDAGQRGEVEAALRALMIAPEQFMPRLGQYLGLEVVLRRLEAAGSDEALREVVGDMWALALTIEDGRITDVDKALKAAEEALAEALERGASDEEIRKLTENLRRAMDNYIRQLARRARDNPEMRAQPGARTLRRQDLKDMLDRMERLSRSGDREAARQLLQEMLQMLENLQMAQPGDSDVDQALGELDDLIRKQQRLRDRTFGQGQDSRRGRMQGEPDPPTSGLQQEQQTLQDRARKLKNQFAGSGDQGGGGLDGASDAMGDAVAALREGDIEGAVDAQARALESLRKAGREIEEAMGEGQRHGEEERDPLGRPLRRRDLAEDGSVRIPGEIDVQRARRILDQLRSRLGESARPQPELDYIERLLKGF